MSEKKPITVGDLIDVAIAFYNLGYNARKEGGKKLTDNELRMNILAKMMKVKKESE